MTVIGITGGTGCGKTTALEVIASLGGLVIDCDAVYHELLDNSSEMISDISGRFNNVIVDGVLDRKALGNIVFSDSNALEDLNSITHKYVAQEVSRLLSEYEESGGKLAAIDAIALFESGLSNLCSFTVAVTAPEEARAKRIMLRENISYEYAMLRIKAQKKDSYFTDICTYTLVNDCSSKVEFYNKVRDFLEERLGSNFDK